MVGVLDHFFPPSENIAIEYRRGLPVEKMIPSQVRVCVCVIVVCQLILIIQMQACTYELPVLQVYYFIQDLLEKLKFQKYPPGQLKYMIYTKVGDGPKYLNNSQDHLLDSQGNPTN